MISSKERIAITLALFMLLFPLSLMAMDLFGNVTFEGKVIDADTLKPIEGAVVVFEWEKCWPGIGAGELCHFKKVKEARTDTNGEWSIRGPRGNHFPSKARQVLGFVVSWTTPPDMQIYKPGYCRLYQKPGGIKAYPYVNKDKNLEGIILIRMGNTKEEENEYLKKYMEEHTVPFISVKDPEIKLRTLDFDFQYPRHVTRIEDVWDNTMYAVIGIKKPVTQEEKLRAIIFPGNIEHWVNLPLLQKVVKNNMK